MTATHLLQDLAVVVVNFRTSALLAENLTRVQTAIPEASFWVVDNYSDEAERAQVARLADQSGWRFVAASGNPGFGAGCNLGADAAIAEGARSLMMLNPDAVIDRESVVALLSRLEASEGEVVASPRILRPDGSTWFEGNFLDLDDGSIRSARWLATQETGSERTRTDLVPWISGACMVVSSGSWQRLQGFDEDYFMYWEDVDFSYRALQSGIDVCVVEAATAVHDEGLSQQPTGVGRTGFSALYYRMNIRNRMLFASRNLPSDVVRRWRRGSPRAAWAITRRGRGRKQLLKRPVALVDTARAVIEGRRLSAGRADTDPLRVVLSFPEPKPTSNPYTVLLRQSLESQPSLEVEYFSWRRVLTQRADVFHAHWPEAALGGSTRLKIAGKHVAFAGMLAVFRMRGTAWVRTEHNTDLPRGISWATRSLLQSADRSTSLRIVLNPFTPVPAGDPVVTIPHGHYKDWLAKHPRLDPVKGQIGYVGTIRAYKGVPHLLEAFAQLEDDQLSLVVAGRLSHLEYEHELRALADRDPRVRLDLGFVSDAELVRIITASEFVVLPYPEMHNSGMVLCALSLGRPVLVPDNVVNRALRDEVGSTWVYTYTGYLDEADLASTRGRILALPQTGEPNLTSRGWDLSGRRHAEAYRKAAQWRRGATMSDA